MQHRGIIPASPPAVPGSNLTIFKSFPNELWTTVQREKTMPSKSGQHQKILSHSFVGCVWSKSLVLYESFVGRQGIVRVSNVEVPIGQTLIVTCLLSWVPEKAL